ncbi:MAG: hypothetical protein Q7K25_10320 [Actinomycetota bacterium]|nr:hypothetical protein [Actinomycetota bacterium]
MPAQAATPKARSLAVSDIPASFGQSQDFVFSKKPKDYATTITLCSDSKGDPMVSIPASTPQYFAQSIMKPKKKNVFTNVSERIYVYSSPEAAAAAYLQLSQEVVKCTGTIPGPAGEDPKVTDTYAHGSSPGGQYQNFWVQDSTVFESKNPLNAGKTVTLSVYSQAGDAVIQTEVYIDGRPRVPPKQKSDIQGLALTLSSKWAPQ